MLIELIRIKVNSTAKITNYATTIKGLCKLWKFMWKLTQIQVYFPANASDSIIKTDLIPYQYWLPQRQINILTNSNESCLKLQKQYRRKVLFFTPYFDMIVRNRCFMVISSIRDIEVICIIKDFHGYKRFTFKKKYIWK